MRVLFIANTFPSPDKMNAGAFNLRGVQNLLQRGVDVEVVHFRSWSPGRDSVTDYDVDGVRVTSVALPYYVKLSPRFIALNIALYKILFERIFRGRFLGKIDLIHSVGASHAGVISGFIAAKFGLPHIAQCIGTDVNVNLPQLSGYAGVRGWDKGVDHFVGNSGELRDNIHKLYPHKPATVIYRGVNLKEFQPAETTSSAEIMVTYLGGLSPKETKPFGIDQKGGVTLLNAWQLFKKKNPGSSAQLNFCGPNINEAAVTAIIGRHPSDININVIGHVDRKKVAALLQQSHIVILPSMFEGLPNVAMEAAASGAALIGTRVGGIPEVIKDGFNGYLVERRNAQQIADRLQDLVDSPERLRSFRKQGRQYMEEKFDSSQFADGYLSLYNEVISKYNERKGLPVYDHS